MGELGAETKSMATHAQTQHDYSPPCVAAPGTQTRQVIAAGFDHVELTVISANAAFTVGQ